MTRLSFNVLSAEPLYATSQKLTPDRAPSKKTLIGWRKAALMCNKCGHVWDAKPGNKKGSIRQAINTKSAQINCENTSCDNEGSIELLGFKCR